MNQYFVDFKKVLNTSKKQIGVIKVMADTRHHAFDEAYNKIANSVLEHKNVLRNMVSIRKIVEEQVSKNVPLDKRIEWFNSQVEHLILMAKTLELPNSIKIINRLIDIRKELK